MLITLSANGTPTCGTTAPISVHSRRLKCSILSPRSDLPTYQKTVGTHRAKGVAKQAHVKTPPKTPLTQSSFPPPFHRISPQSLTQQGTIADWLSQLATVSHWPSILILGASRSPHPTYPNPGFPHSGVGKGVDHRAQVAPPVLTPRAALLF